MKKKFCRSTIAYVMSAVNVFETRSQDNEIDVDLTKRVPSHARGNTNRDIREDKECQNSCENGKTSLRAKPFL